MPRGEHLKKAWQLDPEGMKRKTQGALQKAREVRAAKAETMNRQAVLDLDHLWNWLEERERAFQIRVRRMR